MNLSDLVTRIRRKVGETNSNNSKWTDAQIADTLNAVKKRVHRKIAEAAPGAFRVSVDVTLPANTREVEIPWNRSGPPKVLYPIYDITDSSDPGSLVVPGPKSLQPELECIDVRGRTLYSTKSHSSARTFRLYVQEVSNDLTDDEDEPDDIPEDWQEDVLVYGTAIDLQDEEPTDIPEIWVSRHVEAVNDLLRFWRNQTQYANPRYGERYVLSNLWGTRRSHVR